MNTTLVWLGYKDISHFAIKYTEYIEDLEYYISDESTNLEHIGINPDTDEIPVIQIFLLITVRIYYHLYPHPIFIMIRPDLSVGHLFGEIKQRIDELSLSDTKYTLLLNDTFIHNFNASLNLKDIGLSPFKQDTIKVNKRTSRFPNTFVHFDPLDIPLPDPALPLMEN
eukprot:UN13359